MRFYALTAGDYFLNIMFIITIDVDDLISRRYTVFQANSITIVTVNDDTVFIDENRIK